MKTKVERVEFKPSYHKKNDTLTDPDARASSDNSTSFLSLHDLPNGLTALERAFEMNGDNLVPIRLSHRQERLVSQDAGVGDKNVDTSVGVERSGKSGFDDQVGILGGGDSRDGFSSSCTRQGALQSDYVAPIPIEKTNTTCLW